MEIEGSLEEFRNSENYDAEKEQQYNDLANLFGITLTNGTLPEGGIPEGINPDDLPF